MLSEFDEIFCFWVRLGIGLRVRRKRSYPGFGFLGRCVDLDVDVEG
jgi:hypothetical protein